MNRFKNLKVWQQALDLSLSVYELTDKFPKNEMYGLASQMKRCGVSVPSNIAEGAARNNEGEFYHFLGIASGSSAELYTQTVIANRRKYITEEESNSILSELDHIMNRMFKLQETLNHKNPKHSTRNRIH